MSMTPDDRLKRAMKWTLLGVLIFFVLLILLGNANSKGLHEIVHIQELSSTWTGKKIAISGYAQSCEPMRGRLGSNYVKCVVVSDAGKVTVYTPFPLYNIAQENVTVLGTYTNHGRYGGLLADHFIVADAVMRDWGK